MIEALAFGQGISSRNLKPQPRGKASDRPDYAYYNFCRVHRTLRVTPAMEAGLADYIWSLGGTTSNLVQSISIRPSGSQQPQSLWPSLKWRSSVYRLDTELTTRP